MAEGKVSGAEGQASAACGVLARHCCSAHEGDQPLAQRPSACAEATRPLRGVRCEAAVPSHTLSPRAIRGLALIVVSLVVLAVVIVLHVRPAPGAAPVAVAVRQPDGASTMAWISAREGWISAFDRRAGASTLFHTTDAGRRWSRQRVARGVETPEFFDSLHGVLASDAGTLRTSDGGRHWQSLTLPTGARGQQPAFADARHGWVWDPSSAGLLATVDGGAHWRRLAAAGLPAAPAPPHLLGFHDALHGWLAVGDALFGTADGGATWRSALALPPFASNLAPSRANGAVWWAWSANELQVTHDGGDHWTVVALPGWNLMRVQPLDARTAWVAATVIDALGVPRWTLFSTADSGLTWIPAITPALG
jgi:photosystem II stability/assembly factor-like uncharacterized protein